MEKYELTDEHRKQLETWSKKWIKNAFSTESIKEDKKPLIRKYIKELYNSANLTPPPDNRIIFVDSPFIGIFVAGFSAAIWYARDKYYATSDAIWDATNEATREATWDATWDATWAATREATREATRDATRESTWYAALGATRVAAWGDTWEATMDATRDATSEATRMAAMDAAWEATRDATRVATWEAAWEATRDATRVATRVATWDAALGTTMDAAWGDTWGTTMDATREATWVAASEDDREDARKDKWYSFTDMVGFSKTFFGKNYKFFLNCANNSYSLYNGGNFCSDTVSFLSFFRHIYKLKIDYTKWDAYEKLAELTGPRYMHKKFCIICDKPKYIKTDDNNRPHCIDGPFLEWRDGSKLYSIEGVRIPGYIVENKNLISIEAIQKEKNFEVQRIMIQQYGIAKYLKEIDADIIDIDNLGIEGSSTRCLMKDKFNNKWLVGTDGSTERVYYMSVPNKVNKCKEAHEELSGFDESKIIMEG